MNTWTVLGSLSGRYTLCRCGCGATRMVFVPDLKRGKSQSCKTCSYRRTSESVKRTLAERRRAA